MKWKGLQKGEYIISIIINIESSKKLWKSSTWKVLGLGDKAKLNYQIKY